MNTTEVQLTQEGLTQKLGVFSVVNLDRMNNTELEFDELSKSLNRIQKKINEYMYANLLIKGRGITVFFQKDNIEHVEQYLLDLAEIKTKSKEPSEFNNFIDGKEFDQDQSIFWWDTQKHLIFWKKNDTLKSRIRKILEEPIWV